MLILNVDDVRKALPMRAAIAAMRQAFAALGEGRAQVPLRATLSVPPEQGTTLVMPAFVEGEEGRALILKVVSVFPGNRDRNLPLIHAAVIALEAETGRVLAVLEGGAVTAIRTGATSGLATDLLARKNSRTLALFGCGVQARTQLEAVCTVRAIETVWVQSPTPRKVEAFLAEMAGRGPIPRDIRRATDARQAVAEADIICTATTSATPVFDDDALKPGVHVNAVGSFQPHVQEIPAATVARALVVVDEREAALSEAGDLIRPLEEGLIHRDHVHADLGEVVLGKAAGRSSEEQLTLFKSVGLAVQDAVAARAVLEEAGKAGLGERVRW